MSNHIIVGSRGSQLALWQANFVASELQELGFTTEIKVIKTKGDQIQHLSFDKIEGKGFFTTEIENALLANQIDMAVHSLKDLPTESDDNLMLAGLSYREDPADLLIVHPDVLENTQLLKLPVQAKVGTSSARRKAQIRNVRPDLSFIDIRGNVPTRLKKCNGQDIHAIVLAAAGLKRLQLSLDAYHVIRLHPREFPPAPGQGVLAYQCRRDDMRMREIITRIHKSATSECTNVERKVMKLIGGGCHAPLGVYCEKDINNNFHTWANYAVDWNANLKQTKISLSTYAGMAESVFESLEVK